MSRDCKNNNGSTAVNLLDVLNQYITAEEATKVRWAINKSVEET